jgi:hypothetical protein
MIILGPGPEISQMSVKPSGEPAAARADGRTAILNELAKSHRTRSSSIDRIEHAKPTMAVSWPIPQLSPVQQRTF